MRRSTTLTASFRSAFGTEEQEGYCPPQVTIYFHDADVCSWDRGEPLSSATLIITEEQVTKLIEASNKARGPLPEEGFQTGFSLTIVERPCIKRGNFYG